MTHYVVMEDAGERVIGVITVETDAMSDGFFAVDDPELPEWIRDKPPGVYDGDTRELVR